MSDSLPRRCVVVRAPTGDAAPGRQGLSYLLGISAESAGARGLCLHLLTIPPGGRAHAHYHQNHESAIYVIAGEAVTYFGDRLQEQVVTRAGDFLYIPPGLPHLPANRSASAPCVAVVARTDPHEQESVILCPDLDALRFW